MKTEHWLLLGVGAYLLFTKSGLGIPSGISSQYGPQPTGTRSPSGGSGGGGVSSNLNPAAATAKASQTGQPTLATDGYYYCADGTQVNDSSLCPVDTSGYITCPDGTLVNDPSLCAGGVTCWDGSQAADESQCPDPTQTPGAGFTASGYVDTGDPCDPNSSAYDPSQCGSDL